MKQGTIRRSLLAWTIAAGCPAAACISAKAAELDGNALLSADKDPNNWVMYHGAYNAWHYSALDQINTQNVKDLKVAWMHNPGSSPHGGIQSFPLAIDGRLYYTIANDQLWAVDGATGATLWKFTPKIDEDWANTITTVYNRGLAAAYGKLYMGTVDGRLIAVDMQTGKPVWDTKLIDVAKGIKGITGAPLVVKDKVLVGPTGGERSGCCGPIFAVDAHTGQKVLGVRYDWRRRSLARELGQR